MVCGNCGCGGWSHRCTVCKVSYVLLAIGGINWGLIGLGGLLHTNLNVVDLILGWSPVLVDLVYLLVGVATVSFLSGKCPCRKNGCTCGAGGEGMKCEPGNCHCGNCGGMKDSSMPKDGEMKK